jgi:WD40 repeat protein
VAGPDLLVWEEYLHRPPRRLRTGSPRHLTGLAFHPTGRYLATASNDRTVRLWEVGSWRQVTAYTWAAGRMRSVAFAPDGLTAAAGGEAGQFVLFDVDV